MKSIDAYKKIFKVINDCAEDIDYSVDIRDKLNLLITREKIQESFGIKLKDCYEYDDTYFKVGYDQYIAKYGEDYKRTISWSDDGRQPEDEWLLAITYPTGAYIFGDDYQKETFEQFFNELKSFEPKYVDTNNHCVYYTADKAKAVYEKVDEIYQKYRIIAEHNRKASKVEALKKQLADLEGQ
jgi:IS1 family transposase